MRFFRYLLFDKGTGWLRWRLDQRWSYSQLAPPDYYTVAPPLRRLWAMVEDWWYGWEEEPTAWTYLKDENRSTDLWNFGGRLLPWRR